MRYWWVNQNKTYRHEVQGGYLWSPKRKRNGAANAFYDFMRVVAPGDIVFSFADTIIKAIGCVVSHAYEAPKPVEFAAAGAHWELIGWRVDVRFAELLGALRPKSHMTILARLLPAKYAPLQPDGDGLQGVYLTMLPDVFAAALVDLIGYEARVIIEGRRAADPATEPVATGLMEWEEHQLAILHDDDTLDPTTRQALVLARRGQGLFKQRVGRIERACRVTKVDKLEHLRASHCKPWRDANHQERLDGENGLLLTPNIDHLFDRGFISFEDTGNVLVSPVAHVLSLERMGLAPGRVLNVGRFSSGQSKYLDFHRENVFLQSRFLP